MRMTKILAGLAIIIVVLGGGVVGFLSGAQSISRDQDHFDRIASQRSAQAFYSTLNQLDNTGGLDRLALLLAPSFLERRVDLQQTLDRQEFLNAIAMEHRTFPGRKLIPVRTSSDGAWVMVLLQMADDGPGTFAGVPLPTQSLIRREMLNIVDGKIVERIVLAGEDSSFWTLPTVQLPFRGIGPQTIDVVSRTYAPYGDERIEWDRPAVLIVRMGQLQIESTTQHRLALNTFAMVALPDPGSMEITNVSNEPAELAMILVGPAAIPQSVPDGLHRSDASAGISVQRVAQSTLFFSTATCIDVSAGLTTLLPSSQLPSHDTSAYEVVTPSRGNLDAHNDNAPFLRTYAERAWQDSTPFTALAEGVSTVAPPGSRTWYVATGNQPTSAWFVSIQLETACSA